MSYRKAGRGIIFFTLAIVLASLWIPLAHSEQKAQQGRNHSERAKSNKQVTENNPISVKVINQSISI